MRLLKVLAFLAGAVVSTALGAAVGVSLAIWRYQ